MKKILAAFMLFMTMGFATAAPTPADMDKLTDVQKAELALQVAKQVEEQKAAVQNPQQVKQWVNYGTEVGQALAGAARELGIVANEFIKTPAGQLTMGLIIWKVMGHDIVHVGLALILFFTLVPGWIYMFNRMCVVKGYQYQEYEQDGKTKTRRIKQYYNTVNDDITGTRFIMGVVLGIIILIVVLVGIN
jgi:hypothetical protein